ncbi:uncharacterized protein METZ01_LOCUS127285 [marine metagenome]|uniref:Uncharacterized protein n=1 Tax=marine metagenome TaxID=408172 RepID=A0A381YCX4_9ZZZZ
MGDGMRKSQLNRRTQVSLTEHFTGGTAVNCAFALFGAYKTTTIQYFQRYY